jgi:hypothetical protein
MTAFAAYIDYSTVHRAIQAKGSSRWKDIDRQVYEINPNLWYAMTDTSYCVDSFVRWPDKNGKPMFKAVVEGHVAKIVSETTSQYGPLPLQGNR